MKSPSARVHVKQNWKATKKIKNYQKKAVVFSEITFTRSKKFKINIFLESISHLAGQFNKKMRSIGICFLSVLLTSFVVLNAFYHKKQFYPTVVYITKSNSSMAVSIHHHLLLWFRVCLDNLLLFLSWDQAADQSKRRTKMIWFWWFSLCAQVIYMQFFVCVLLLGKLFRKVSLLSSSATDKEVLVILFLNICFKVFFIFTSPYLYRDLRCFGCDACTSEPANCWAGLFVVAFVVC